MTISHEQPVNDRGGPADAASLALIADSVIRRVGSSMNANTIDKAVHSALNSYVVIPRATLPSPTLDAQEVWHADVDEHEERVGDGDDAEVHLRIARAHLTLAGAIMDSDLLDKWRTLYSLQSRWAKRLTDSDADYEDLRPETRLAVDELINAGLEP